MDSPGGGQTMNTNIAERTIRQFLDSQSLNGENYKETPQRVVKVWKTLLNTPEPKLKTFPLNTKPSLIVVKDYVSWSFCPHHLLPVRYEFRIGYLPFKKVVGLSKLPRIADYVLRTLPLQEDVAGLITAYIKKMLEPMGCGCIVKGEHQCMRMRGIESQCVSAVSSSLEGVFLYSPSVAEEFRML